MNKKKKELWSFLNKTLESPSTPNSSASDLTPKRKRKSRWGDEQKIIIPGLPTAVNKLDKQQSEKYLCKSQISM
jgi:splicing factor 1